MLKHTSFIKLWYLTGVFLYLLRTLINLTTKVNWNDKHAAEVGKIEIKLNQ